MVEIVGPMRDKRAIGIIRDICVIRGQKCVGRGLRLRLRRAESIRAIRDGNFLRFFGRGSLGRPPASARQARATPPPPLVSIF